MLVRSLLGQNRPGNLYRYEIGGIMGIVVAKNMDEAFSTVSKAYKDCKYVGEDLKYLNLWEVHDRDISCENDNILELRR